LDLVIVELKAQRRHIAQALTGLSEIDMTTAHAPTSWSPIALVHHLALDVERWWFAAIVAGDADARQYFESHPGGAWSVPPDTDVTALYTSEQSRADEILRSVRVEDAPSWWPEFLGPEQNVGEIALHVTTETATHAGQLDIVRESIDQTQWLVLDPAPSKPTSPGRRPR
jgi:hypothetical protein